MINNLKPSIGTKIINIIEKNILEVLIINNNDIKYDFPINNHIIGAKLTLIKMINSLPTNSLLLNFIEDSVNLKYGLNAKIENNNLTPFYKFSWDELLPSLKVFKSNVNYNNPALINNLKLEPEPEITFNLQGGTYVFSLNTTNEIYIGSAACFSERIVQHKNQFRGHGDRALHKLTSNNQKDLN